MPDNRYETMQIMTIEIIGSMLLGFVCAGLYCNVKAAPEAYAIGHGGMMACLIACAYPTSGACFNPARVLGPSM